MRASILKAYVDAQFQRCPEIGARSNNEPASEDWAASSLSSGQLRQRAPRALHARLAARARQKGVSLNTFVTTLLTEGLAKAGTSHRSR